MNQQKSLIIFTIILIVLCFASTAIFTTDSYFYFFDLSSSKAQNIGGAIGGMTAPIIGLFSSILLYLALTKQIQSNKEQQLKNESDIIFSLLNQMDEEVKGFYHKYNQGKDEFKFYGIEAIHEFGRMFRYEYLSFHTAKHGTFSKVVYQSHYLELIIDTFNLINKRIEISPLSGEMKQLFITKIASYYNAVLEIGFVNISKTIEANDYLKDALADKFQKFVEVNTNL